MSLLGLGGSGIALALRPYRHVFTAMSLGLLILAAYLTFIRYRSPWPARLVLVVTGSLAFYLLFR